MLRPFSKYCVEIGAIPRSIIESLSYEEQLFRFYNFVKDKIIPAIEGNQEAVKRIEEWFDNLDVQEEINNKLDAMVEDGTMNEIINQEIFGDINKKLDLLFNKKIIIVGDSYAGGAVPSGESPVDSWERLLRQKLGFTLNTDCWSTNQGGTGFTTSTTWLQLLQNVNTNGHDNEITDILICGGYNDAGSNINAVQSAVNAIISYVDTKYPNAKVHVGFIGNTTNTANKYNIGSMARIYMEACKNAGIHYLSNVEHVLHNYYSMFTSDGIHPNQTGQNALCDNIIQAWLYGSTDVKYGNQAINSSFGILTTMLDNSIVRFSCPSNATFNVTASGVSCSGGNGIELTTIGYGYIIGNSNSVCGMTAHCYANLGGGNYKTLSGTVTIEGNKLKFYPIQISDDGRGFYSLTCTQLTFTRFSGVFDSLYN